MNGSCHSTNDGWIALGSGKDHSLSYHAVEMLSDLNNCIPAGSVCVDIAYYKCPTGIK